MSSDNFNVITREAPLYKSRNWGVYISDLLVKYLKRIFVLDLRSLALLRIGMGAVVLLDLLIRSTDLTAHYTDKGVLPLRVLFEHAWNPWSFSLHAISGLWTVQSALFLLSGVFAFCLLVGWKTRLFAFLTWLMVTSVQNRNPFILQGGDDLLRMVLFWGMFLPWNRRYSIDSLGKEQNEQHSYTGLAGAAYLLQICFLYFFSALLKNSAEWKTDGTAIYYALSLDQMVFPLGKYLYQFPEIMKYLTFLVYYTELLTPLLFFIPVYTTFFRSMGILLFALLHLGISFTLFVGLFFIIGTVTLLGLLPQGPAGYFERKTVRLRLLLEQWFSRLTAWIKKRAELRVEICLKTGKPRLIKMVREGFLFFCLLFVVAWNLRNQGVESYLTQHLAPAGQMIRIDQNWGMFAPTVFKDDGWYVLDGTTLDGKHIDLNRAVVSLFKNDRWRKYSENYLFISNGYLRPYYSNFIFDQWNREYPDKKIKRLEVIYMKEVTQPDYQKVIPTKEVLAITEDNHENRPD
jgi:hypothetical protein